MRRTEMKPKASMAKGASGGISRGALPSTKANEAMHPKVMSEEAFGSDLLRKAAFYADETAIVLNMDVKDGLALLAEAGVQANCIVTSPPFYGQRDYEVEGQIGLEACGSACKRDPVIGVIGVQ